MKINERILYLITLISVVLLALSGAVLAVFSELDLALAAMGLSIVGFPALSHLRMRRMVMALGRSRATPMQPDLAKVNSSLSTIEQSISTLSDELHELSIRSFKPTNISSSSESVQLANEIRRESRMIRVIAEDLRGNLMGPEQIKNEEITDER